MNSIPSIEKMDVTRSVTASALSWLGLNDTDILKAGCFRFETMGGAGLTVWTCDTRYQSAKGMDMFAAG